jgi:hypothetical protein
MRLPSVAEFVLFDGSVSMMRARGGGARWKNRGHAGGM